MHYLYANSTKRLASYLATSVLATTKEWKATRRLTNLTRNLSISSILEATNLQMQSDQVSRTHQLCSSTNKHITICTRNPLERKKMLYYQPWRLQRLSSIKCGSTTHLPLIIPGTICGTLSFNVWGSNHEFILIFDVNWSSPHS